MQAHANDLRSEIATELSTVAADTGDERPSDAALDAFVHKVVRDWRQCALRGDVVALLDYAEKVTRDPAQMAETDVETLRQVGWSDRAIHDATQVIGYFAYINRIADALGVKREAGLPVWG